MGVFSSKEVLEDLSTTPWPPLPQPLVHEGRFTGVVAMAEKKEEGELYKRVSKTIPGVRKACYNPCLGQQAVDELIRSYLGYLDEHIIGQVYHLSSLRTFESSTTDADLEDAAKAMQLQLQSVGPSAYQMLLLEADGKFGDNIANRARLALAALLQSTGRRGKLRHNVVQQVFNRRADYIVCQFMSDLRAKTWEKQGIQTHAPSSQRNNLSISDYCKWLALYNIQTDWGFSPGGRSWIESIEHYITNQKLTKQEIERQNQKKREARRSEMRRQAEERSLEFRRREQRREREKELWRRYGEARWKQIYTGPSSIYRPHEPAEFDCLEKRIGHNFWYLYKKFREGLLPKEGEVVPTSERVKLLTNFLYDLRGLRNEVLDEAKYMVGVGYKAPEFLRTHPEWVDAVIEKGVGLCELPFTIYREADIFFRLDWRQGWTLENLDPKLLRQMSSDLTPSDFGIIGETAEALLKPRFIYIS